MAGGRDQATLEQWVDYYENKNGSLPDELNETMALPEEPAMAPNMTVFDDKIGEIMENFKNIGSLIFHPFKLIMFILSMFAQNIFHMAGDHHKAQYVPSDQNIKPVETKPILTFFFDKIYKIEQKIGTIIDLIFHPYKLVFMIITWIFQRITRGLEHVTDYMVPVKLF